MKIHELKSWPKFFAKVITGEKTFEVRLNDRDFQVDDFLFLREWDPESKQYSGRLQYARITYIFGKDDQQSVQVLDSRYVVLGISLYWSVPAQLLPGQEMVSSRPEPNLLTLNLARHLLKERVTNIRTKSGFLALLFQDQVDAVTTFVENEIAPFLRKAQE